MIALPNNIFFDNEGGMVPAFAVESYSTRFVENRIVIERVKGREVSRPKDPQGVQRNEIQVSPTYSDNTSQSKGGRRGFAKSKNYDDPITAEDFDDEVPEKSLAPLTQPEKYSETPPSYRTGYNPGWGTCNCRDSYNPETERCGGPPGGCPADTPQGMRQDLPRGNEKPSGESSTSGGGQKGESSISGNSSDEPQDKWSVNSVNERSGDRTGRENRDGSTSGGQGAQTGDSERGGRGVGGRSESRSTSQSEKSDRISDGYQTGWDRMWGKPGQEKESRQWATDLNVIPAAGTVAAAAWASVVTVPLLYGAGASTAAIQARFSTAIQAGMLGTAASQRIAQNYSSGIRFQNDVIAFGDLVRNNAIRVGRIVDAWAGKGTPMGEIKNVLRLFDTAQFQAMRTSAAAESTTLSPIVGPRTINISMPLITNTLSNGGFILRVDPIKGTVHAWVPAAGTMKFSFGSWVPFFYFGN